MFDYSDMEVKRTEKEVKHLFDVMSCDFSVMEDHGGNEKSLLMELLTCDNEIMETYTDTFLR